MVRILDADAFKDVLIRWRDQLRSSNECGGCGADLLDQVLRALDAQPVLSINKETGAE